MSTPPPNPNGPTPPPGPGGPTAPPYPGGGVPAASSMYPSVQQGYPGISYTSQSSVTYNIGGNPPPAGAAPYPIQSGAAAPYPIQSGAAAPYPVQSGPPPPAHPGQGVPSYPTTPGQGGPAQGGPPPYPLHGGSYPSQAASPYPSQSGGPAGGGSAPPYPSTAGGGYPAPGNSPYPPQGSAAYPGQAGPPRVPPRVSQPAPGHQGSGYPGQPGGAAGTPYPSGGSQPMPAGPAQPYPITQLNVFGQSGQGAHKANQQPGFTAVPQPGPGLNVASRGYAPPMKKALIVGCNYPRTSAELKGCINDANCMKYLLTTKFGFEERNIRLLTDDQAGRQRPTKQFIVEGMHWLVEGAQPGSSLFFHFSGHGSQKRDYVGDEQDGFNETLLPTDYKSAGQIVDDDVNRFLVNSLGPGVSLHAVIDACHSGTAMDLKYRTKYKSGQWVWKDTGTTRKYKGTKGGIAFQFGACKDSEVAQDTNDLSGNAHTGAATFAFIQAVESGGPSQSYAAVLSHMHRCLLESVNGGLGGSVGGGVAGTVIGMLLNGAAKIVGVGKQTPQLSCSERYDVMQPLRI
ncbi:hypothetical protein BSKO_00581 [Bryopsis sp. KO-2023]|nr:hypothetical protein BSKO_00581 [Bryopsis sp. KO-2023]